MNSIGLNTWNNPNASQNMVTIAPRVAMTPRARAQALSNRQTTTVTTNSDCCHQPRERGIFSTKEYEPQGCQGQQGRRYEG